MDLNIKIKQLGTEIGTVGWLAKGLADGSLGVHQGRTKDGSPGLWFDYPGEAGKRASFILALRDPYGLQDTQYAQEQPIILAPRVHDGCWGGDPIGCTDACWRSLMEIAEKWIAHQVEKAATDPAPKSITVVFE